MKKGQLHEQLIETMASVEKKQLFHHGFLWRFFEYYLTFKQKIFGFCEELYQIVPPDEIRNVLALVHKVDLETQFNIFRQAFPEDERSRVIAETLSEQKNHFLLGVRGYLERLLKEEVNVEIVEELIKEFRLNEVRDN